MNISPNLPQEATMTTQTTATFPTLQQTEIQNFLVTPVESASVFLASGPKIIDTNGPIRIPRLASGATVGFVAEGAQIPESGVGFDEVSMLPSTLKSLKVISRVTSEVLRSSAVSLDGILKQRLVSDTATALDNALFTGTGTSNTIKGLLAQSGVATGTLDATEPDSLLDGIGIARANEVKPNRWFLSPADYLSIRKIKDTAGRYILQPDLTAVGQEVLFGVPVTVTSRIPTGKAALADMSLVAVARDVAPSVTIDSSRYFDTDEVALRVVARYDLALLQPKAVTILTATP
ncbi:phage major capsid protein [Tsukamurella pseudospumae]